MTRTIKNSILALLAGIALAACEPSIGSSQGADRHTAETGDLPAGAGATCDNSPNPDDPLATELWARWGVRPRRYQGEVSGDNGAQTLFRQLLPEVTDFVNQKLRENGYEQLAIPAEALAINFIIEGGYIALTFCENRGGFLRCRGKTTRLDGYGDLGIDTIVDYEQELRPWLPESVAALFDQDEHLLQTCVAIEPGVTTRNSDPCVQQTEGGVVEGVWVRSLTDLTLEQGLYANAAMFAYFWAKTADKLASQGVDMAALPPEGQFFWATVGFNASEETALAALRDNGAYWYEQKRLSQDGHTPIDCWGFGMMTGYLSGPDEGESQEAFEARIKLECSVGYPILQFNALLRTASFVYLAREGTLREVLRQVEPPAPSFDHMDSLCGLQAM